MSAPVLDRCANITRMARETGLEHEEVAILLHEHDVPCAWLGVACLVSAEDYEAIKPVLLKAAKNKRKRTAAKLRSTT
jgi:hypothetical protein